MADASRPALVPALRRIEDTLALQGMPPGARHRIAARLREHAEQRRDPTHGIRRWLPALTFAAGAALVLAVIGLRWPADSGAPAAAEPLVRRAGAFTIEGAECRDATEAGATVLRGHCRLVSSTMIVQTWNETRLSHDADGVRVTSGTALFEVAKVADGSPSVRVHVSHGTIEVLGTRFAIDQREGGGHVDLFEGRIRFVDAIGSTDVAPGQRLGWGDERARPTDAPSIVRTDDITIDPDPPPTDPPSPTRRRDRDRSRDASALIDQVTTLREQGRHHEAANVLRRALKKSWDARTAEVLSYELGRILDRHLRDAAAACAHWRRHTRRFPTGRYIDAVDHALARCEP